MTQWQNDVVVVFWVKTLWHNLYSTCVLGMELHIFSPLKSDFKFVFLDIAAATAHMDSCRTKPSIGIMTSRPQSVTLSETSIVTARPVDIFHSRVSFQILSLLFLTIIAYKLSVFSIPIRSLRPGRGYILFFLLILYFLWECFLLFKLPAIQYFEPQYKIKQFERN